MTISNATNRIEYAGNGTTVAFATPKFYDNSHIVAWLVENANPANIATWALTTNYTLSGLGNTNGTLTAVVAPATGYTLVIFRSVPAEQQHDYIENDDFPAESHERALDLLTMIAQQLDTRINRSVRLQNSDISGASVALPAPSALKFFRWNSSATAIEYAFPEEGTVADGSITTAKLGGDITAFSKNILKFGSSTSWLTELGFSTFGKTLINLADAAALRTVSGATAFGVSIYTAASAALARGYLGVTTVGDAIFTAVDAAAARVALGFSSAGSTIATTATANGAAFVTAADYAAQKVLWGVTAFGNSVLAAADAAASRALHGFTSIGSNIVTAADAAAVRALLSVGTDIPAGGVVQTVFSSTASVDLRIQGTTHKVLVRAVIQYSGITAGTVYLTVSDEGAPPSTLRTLNLDSTDDDVNTATIEWEYTPGIVALHNLTYGVAVTGVTLAAQTISATEIKGGFTGTALPWSPADLTATNKQAFKAGLSPATSAVDRGGTNSMYGGNLGTWWNRLGASDFESTAIPYSKTKIDVDTTYAVCVHILGDAGSEIGRELLSETSHTTEFTVAYRLRCTADTFTGDMRFSAGVGSVPGWRVDSGSVLKRGFILRDNGLIDFGHDDIAGNTATYDASSLDWSQWHTVVLRCTSANDYYLYIDGAQVSSLTGVVETGSPYEADANAHVHVLQDSITLLIFSSYLASTDIGAGADLTSLNTWLALEE